GHGEAQSSERKWMLELGAMSVLEAELETLRLDRVSAEGVSRAGIGGEQGVGDEQEQEAYRSCLEAMMDGHYDTLCDLDDVFLHAEPPLDHPGNNNTPLITPQIKPPSRGTDGDLAKGTDEKTVKATDEDTVRGTDEDKARDNNRLISRVDLPTLLARLPALLRDNDSSSTPNRSSSSMSRSVLASKVTASPPSARGGLSVALRAGLATAETAAEGGGDRSGPSGIDRRANNNNNNTPYTGITNNSARTSGNVVSRDLEQRQRQEQQ
ncbi:unnamed protein product, partial [Laminaria digitata]